MAAAFNTVPEEEPLVEKAATKKPWRRLVGGAAVVSFALGLVAATALSSAASGTSPAGAQTALKSHKKLGSTASASYIVNIACLDKDNNVLWNSKDSSNEYQWAANSYLLPDDAKWSSWDSTDFDYVETSEYVLKHEWAQKCHGFSIAVQGPDGYDAAPTFRVYEGDGNYVAFSDDDGAGYFKAGDNIDSGDLHPVVQNLKGNLDGASEPWALKNSVFLHNPDGVVQGNRYLLVDIKFEPKKHTYAKGAHRCVIDADVISDGWEIKHGGISGCDISPPAYSCDVDNLIMYYTGSLRNLNDGAPIDIEFKNFATLDMPLNNIEIVYDLNQGQQECVDMCDWANGGAWKASNDECWMNVALQTIGNKGLGPVTIWGNGQITTSFLEGQSIPDGRGIVTSYPEDQGLQAKAVRVQNEWSVQASALVITQDVEYPSFKDVGYALNVQGISFGNLWPRQDATVVHQACYYSSLWDDCLGLAEKHGALLKNINLVAWWWQSDAPNLSAMNSKIDTSFFVATDDAMHARFGVEIHFRLKSGARRARPPRHALSETFVDAGLCLRFVRVAQRPHLRERRKRHQPRFL